MQTDETKNERQALPLAAVSRSNICQKVKPHRNKFIVLDNCLDSIPALKGGKSDVGAIISFVQDIEMYRKFRCEYLFASSKKELDKLLTKWNDFINKRELENYVPHGESQHRNYYYILF